MKYVNFFLILATLLSGCSGCQSERHEEDDGEEMALDEELNSEHLIGDPPENPQEILVLESADLGFEVE